MLEYFIIIGMLLVLTIPIIALFFSEYNAMLRESQIYNSIRWLIDLDNDIRNIKYQGNGSYVIKYYPYPIALNSIQLIRNNNTFVIYNISDVGQITYIYPFKIKINNSRWYGRIVLNISNIDGEVHINRID